MSDETTQEVESVEQTPENEPSQESAGEASTEVDGAGPENGSVPEAPEDGPDTAESPVPAGEADALATDSEDSSTGEAGKPAAKVTAQNLPMTGISVGADDEAARSRPRRLRWAISRLRFRSSVIVAR